MIVSKYMKKGIFITSLLAVVLVPQIVLAAWWNPFSWFNNWAFIRQDKVVEEESLKERIEQLENHLEEVTNKSTATESIVESDSAHNQDKSNTYVSETKQNYAHFESTVVPDVCSNLEGVQTSVPDNYSLADGKCEPVSTVDLCPNILGVQTEAPSGRSYYKNTGTCLTNAEITRYEDSVAQTTQEEEYCDNFSAEITRLEQEYYDTKSDFNAEVNEILYGGSGATASSRNASASEYWRTHDPILDEMSDNINLKRSQWNRECLNN